MPVIDIIAKRMERARNAGKPVLYKYDELSEKFRTQVDYVLTDLVHKIDSSAWDRICKALSREMGVFDLVVDGHYSRSSYYSKDQCRAFIRDSEDVEWVLSLVEIAFIDMSGFVESKPYGAPAYMWDDPYQDNRAILDEAISELNQRFQENAVGYRYQYPPGQIVRMDSQFLHAEVVEPAVSLLYDEGFTGALDEFLKAHKHYREGNNKEAISSALNAFESVMKTICDIRGWEYDAQKATARALIRTLLDNNLIPSSLQATLESGVPTIRNNFAGHGQGSEPVEVPDYLASYALNLTASNIVFLVEAHKASK